MRVGLCEVVGGGGAWGVVRVGKPGALREAASYRGNAEKLYPTLHRCISTFSKCNYPLLAIG